MKMKKKLEVENLDVYYGKHNVLSGVSIYLNTGEIVALLGRNGAGKTTLIKAILGLIRPVKGRIKVDGIDITGWHPKKVVELGIAVVPQGARIFPDLTVMENLKINNKNFQEEKLHEVLEFFPQIKEKLDLKGKTLSGGERQMVSIVRALLRDPSIILMDEPFAALMPKIVEQLKELILSLSEKNVTFLIIEQNIQQVLEISDRAYILSGGKISCEGVADKFLNDPKELARCMGIIVS